MISSERDKLIEDRAKEIFSRENQDPAQTWDAEFIERGQRVGTTAAGEGLRGEVRRRAETELISEGRIAP